MAMYTFTKKEWIIFFAGAEAMHTVSHALLYFSGGLPMTFYSWVITAQLNAWAVIINAFITIGLLWWAQAIAKK